MRPPPGLRTSRHLSAQSSWCKPTAGPQPQPMHARRVGVRCTPSSQAPHGPCWPCWPLPVRVSQQQQAPGGICWTSTVHHVSMHSIGCASAGTSVVCVDVYALTLTLCDVSVGPYAFHIHCTSIDGILVMQPKSGRGRVVRSRGVSQAFKGSQH